MPDDRRDQLAFMHFLLKTAGHLADQLPDSIPVAGQIRDTVEEVEFLQILLDADPALFEPWGDG